MLFSPFLCSQPWPCLYRHEWNPHVSVGAFSFCFFFKTDSSLYHSLALPLYFCNKLSLTSVEDQGPVHFSIAVQRLPSIKQPTNQPTYHHRVTIAFDKTISPACLSTVETERGGTREGKQTTTCKKEQRYGNSSLSLRPQRGLFSASSTAIPASIEDSKKRKKGRKEPGGEAAIISSASVARSVQRSISSNKDQHREPPPLLSNLLHKVPCFVNGILPASRERRAKSQYTDMLTRLEMPCFRS